LRSATGAIAKDKSKPWVIWEQTDEKDSPLQLYPFTPEEQQVKKKNKQT